MDWSPVVDRRSWEGKGDGGVCLCVRESCLFRLDQARSRPPLSLSLPHLVRFHDFGGHGVAHAGPQVVVHDGQGGPGLVHDLEEGGDGLGRVLWREGGEGR